MHFLSMHMQVWGHSRLHMCVCVCVCVCACVCVCVCVCVCMVFTSAYDVLFLLAQFKVHTRGSSIIALQNKQEPSYWLAIYNGKVKGTVSH